MVCSTILSVHTDGPISVTTMACCCILCAQAKVLILMLEQFIVLFLVHVFSGSQHLTTKNLALDLNIGVRMRWVIDGRYRANKSNKTSSKGYTNSYYLWKLNIFPTMMYENKHYHTHTASHDHYLSKTEGAECPARFCLLYQSWRSC